MNDSTNLRLLILQTDQVKKMYIYVYDHICAQDMHVGTNLFSRGKPLCTYTICLMVRKYITIIAYYCICILLGKILKVSISSLFFKRNYFIDILLL